MKNRNWLIIFIVVASLAVLGVSVAMAAPAVSPAEKVYWCHVTPSGNEVQLHISINALIQAGHVGADGNPLHAGDYPGLCENPTPPVCEDPLATNYLEEGDCEYPPDVCEDPSALNYGEEGDCEYPPDICEDEAALNYGQEGECEYPPYCDDINATNYGEDEECEYPPDVCTDDSALNYGQEGECEYPPCDDCGPPPVIPTPDPEPKTYINVLGMGCASCPGANLGVCAVSSGSTSYVVFKASSPNNVTVSVNGITVPVVNVYMFDHSPYKELAEAEGWSSGPNTYIGEFTQYWAYDGGTEIMRFMISSRYGSGLDPVQGDICPPLTCNP